VGGPAFDRFTGWWRSAQLAVVGAALGGVGLVLVGQLGTPAAQLRTLRHLGDAWADPVACVLALLTLVVEALVAYLLIVLVLRSLSILPGTLGRLAARMTFLVTPVAVRGILDLLVGGALLAHSTLALLPTTPPGHRSVPARTPIAASLSFMGTSQPTDSRSLADSSPFSGPCGFTGSGSFTGSWSSASSLVPAALPHQVPAGFRGVARVVSAAAGVEPVETRPTSRRSSAPLPPWLGGGPSIGGGPSVATSEQPPTTADRTGATRPGASANPSENGAGPAARVHIVEPHDTLWDIAVAHLAPADRSAANVHRYWQQVYQRNRTVIGADPDLIHPGIRLEVPPYHRGRR
jgi:hypothetical protein